MIYARLAPDQEVEQASQPHLAEMAREGLRTLCLGQRDIGDREFQVSFTNLWPQQIILFVHAYVQCILAISLDIPAGKYLLDAHAQRAQLYSNLQMSVSSLTCL